MGQKNHDPMEQKGKKGDPMMAPALLLQNDDDCSGMRGTVPTASAQWNKLILKTWTSLNQGVKQPPPNPEKKETPTHVREKRTAVK